MTEALRIGDPIVLTVRVGPSGCGAVQRALQSDGHCWLCTQLVLESCSWSWVVANGQF